MKSCRSMISISPLLGVVLISLMLVSCKETFRGKIREWSSSFRCAPEDFSSESLSEIQEFFRRTNSKVEDSQRWLFADMKTLNEAIAFSCLKDSAEVFETCFPAGQRESRVETSVDERYMHYKSFGRENRALSQRTTTSTLRGPLEAMGFDVSLVHYIAPSQARLDVRTIVKLGDQRKLFTAFACMNGSH